MPLLPMNLDENQRIKLGLILCYLNIFLTLVGLALLSLSLYLKYTIEDKFVLISHYDNDSVVWMLIALSIFWITLHGLGSKMVYDCRSFHTRQRSQYFLMLWLLVLFFLPWIGFGCATLLFKHESYLLDILTNGLYQALKKYRSDGTVKRIIDTIQLKFSCCGSVNYEDWFKIGWMHTKYLNKQTLDIKKKVIRGDYIADDVPFSCCKIKHLGPCVHSSYTTLKNDPKMSFNSTIHERGCSDALIDSFDELLDISAYATISTSIIEGSYL
ncbi:peripherin-2-like [Gordionus sp. m RMFG-2023]|uniref:peripherin-2-like n=1 Tax=Gordionus sp. m RMFG-2023 TaxID=3053472 RepID=UPI0031FBB610